MQTSVIVKIVVAAVAIPAVALAVARYSAEWGLAVGAGLTIGIVLWGVAQARYGCRADLDLTYRQVDALITLNQYLARTDLLFPSMRGWSIAPDFGLEVVRAIHEERPDLVVELGSGNSTLLAAAALQRTGGGRIVALEHDERYAERTRSLLERAGLGEVAEVRTAALEAITVGGDSYRWYDRSALEDLEDVGVVIVDGPPSRTGRHARYPALPLLEPRLAPDAVLLLDDGARAAEQAIVERWAGGDGGWSAEYLPLKKGAWRLERRGTGRG